MPQLIGGSDRFGSALSFEQARRLYPGRMGRLPANLQHH